MLSIDTNEKELPAATTKGRIKKLSKGQSISTEYSFNELKRETEKKSFFVMPRVFVSATFPHSKPDGLLFKRKNGHYTLTLTANSLYGLPYGALLRILLIYLCTMAKNNNSPEISLGNSLTTFIKKLSLRNIGGERGSAARVRDQLMRLLTCSISFDYQDKKKGICENEQFQIGRSFKFWWDVSKGGKGDLSHTSKIVLSKDFYDDLMKHGVPVDIDALNALRRSPLQIDLYMWLSYRFFKLKKDALIPWQTLMEQFGADYANTAQGIRNFKKKFLQALKKVWTVYPEANVSILAKGLLLSPSDTHVKKKQKQTNNLVDNSSYPH